MSLSPDVVDLLGFLKLAVKLGDGALYVRTETFGLDPDTGEPEEVPARLICREGQVCELGVAFAASGHGLLHFWEQTEPWYQEFLNSQDAEMLRDADEERRIGGEERDRLAAEVAEAILADREFRASSPGIRRRRAQMLVPEGTDRHVGWDAADRARERAEEMSDQAYCIVQGSSMNSQLSSLPVPAGSRPPQPGRVRRPLNSS